MTGTIQGFRMDHEGLCNTGAPGLCPVMRASTIQNATYLTFRSRTALSEQRPPQCAN